MKRKKERLQKIIKRVILPILLLFVLMNVVIALHAYSITHLNPKSAIITPEGFSMSASEKLLGVFLGFDIPKPKTRQYPNGLYETLEIPCRDDNHLEAWLLRTDSVSQGLIIVFHGFLEEKSSHLSRAKSLLSLGYDVMLVDFMAAGGSSGTQTTIGYYEADNVKSVYDYVSITYQYSKIYLSGFSMGAVAIMKAQHDNQMAIDGIMLEAPYGTLEGTIGARIDLVGLPRFPLMQLVTFWGGIVNDFDAFEFRPQDYGCDIHVPTLCLFGGKDQYVSQEEGRLIFDNLGSTDKELYFFPESKHESYLVKYADDWKYKVSTFLEKSSNK